MLFFGLLFFILGAVAEFRAHDNIIDMLNLEVPIAFHGKASFYGKEDGFHGKCMANGEFYDKEAMTAAHRFLPLGTRVRVRYGGHSVILRITDRGPYKKGRIIDLSEAAARKLGLIEKGVDQVTVEVLSEPEEPETHHHENTGCLKEKDKAPGEQYGQVMHAGVVKIPAFSCPTGRFFGSVVCF